MLGYSFSLTRLSSYSVRSQRLFFRLWQRSSRVSVCGGPKRRGQRRTTAASAHKVYTKTDPQAGKGLQQTQIFRRWGKSEDSAEAQPHRNAGERTFSTQTWQWCKAAGDSPCVAQNSERWCLCSTGEDMVSEQEDEAETRGSGPLCSPDAGVELPGPPSGAVPVRGRAETAHGGRSGLLCAPAAGPPAADDHQPRAPCPHSPPTFLLKWLLWAKHLNQSAIQNSKSFFIWLRLCK